jgi:hypothetical protein
MQQFIAKFKNDIQGVHSGFDRVLFRGSLRRLSHPLGMKWYLSQNDILCKNYEDHVKAVSQKIKKAALAPFQQAKSAGGVRLWLRRQGEDRARLCLRTTDYRRGRLRTDRHGDGPHVPA